MRIPLILLAGALVALATPAMAQRHVRAGFTPSRASAKSTSHQRSRTSRHTTTYVEKKVWVKGYDEVIEERVWIAGRFECHRVVQRVCGVEVVSNKRVWVAGHYEFERRIVHHPGYYKVRRVKQDACGCAR